MSSGFRSAGFALVATAVAALVAFGGAGCLQSGLAQCADGTLCPSNLVCAPVSGCATPAAIAACVGIAELDACSISGGPGECRSGVCVPASCGNGLVDATLGEVCDDGNTRGGDGCSADCKSNETCGNGVVDVLAGESCDDGNLRALDGCAPNCQLETLTSEQLVTVAASPPTSPSARKYSAATYDPSRKLVVLFGGDDGTNYLKDTWTYDGATWHLVPTTHGPSRRFGHAMTYDSLRHRVLLYGGDGGAFQDDTWAFDGATWTDLNATGPACRFIGMAFDHRRDRAVLFCNAQTWEFDGTSWAKITTSHVPPDRVAAGIAFDPIRDRVVMFGGLSAGAAIGDTWSYDGVDWTQAQPASSPSARHSLCMAFDTTRGAIVVTMGAPTSATLTWQFDGANWQPVTTATTPPSRIAAAFAYDASRGAAVLFGGVNASFVADTWELGATNWAAAAPIAPGPRYGVALGYDPIRGRTVVFGGHDAATNDLTETWEFDGQRWHPMTPATSPPGRWYGHFAYDAARRKLVLFGGSQGSSTFPNGVSGGTRTLLADTWEWDGATWTPKTPATSPSPRMEVAMAWDGDAQRIVLHGGWSGTATAGSFLADTWSWDGATWTDISTTVNALATPPGRYGHGMTYDPANHRVVMFGGWIDNGGGSPLADTWALVGGQWTRVSTTSAPNPRGDVSLVYDPFGDRIVMVGGTAILGQGYNPQNDAWQLTGATWTQLDPDVLPPGRAMSAAVYDSAHAATLIFGGIRNGVVLGDIWRIGYTPAIATEACASGRDLDGNGAVGCADLDCATVCDPLCDVASATSCAATAAGCGDGTCSELEDCRLCSIDCGACTAVCGDSYCDPGETAASCPGDCP